MNSKFCLSLLVISFMLVIIYISACNSQRKDSDQLVDDHHDKISSDQNNDIVEEKQDTILDVISNDTDSSTVSQDKHHHDFETPDPGEGTFPYRDKMRDFVKTMSHYAEHKHKGFIFIPQNGHELFTVDGTVESELQISYLKSIDGFGREDLFYGYTDDNIPTPKAEQEFMLSFMDLAEKNNVQVLVIDYCNTKKTMDDSYSQNADRGYISFAADHRLLDNIPAYPAEPYLENNDNITTLKSAKNFLYLINPGKFASKNDFLIALQKTNYDMIVIDAFFDGPNGYTIQEIDSLKKKANSAKRLILSYLSIGEAEDYRYYFKEEWKTNHPAWMEAENPNWPGNYKVKYWDADWQSIIFGTEDSYLDRIIAAGFDGVYLDIIDGFDYFEQKEAGQNP